MEVETVVNAEQLQTILTSIIFVGGQSYLLERLKLQHFVTKANHVKGSLLMIHYVNRQSYKLIISVDFPQSSRK